MNDHSDLPVAPARLVSPARRVDPWTFRVQCPYCPKVHIHGAGTSAADAHTYYGERVAHCTVVRHRGRVVWTPPATRQRYLLVPATSVTE